MDLMVGIYRHYKGGYYQVLGIGAHTEREEQMVIYVCVYPLPGSPPQPGLRIRLRPLSMWNEMVPGPNGMEPRFAYVGLEIPTDNTAETASVSDSSTSK
jgi:hypothetical protein